MWYTEVRAFWMLEWLKVWSDLSEECMGCDEPRHDCLSCGVTECERTLAEWLRY